jgi:hypothetical protein
MAEDQDGEFRGATKAQIETLFHRLDEFRNDLRGHCEEERRIWARFESAQEIMAGKIDDIRQWRSRVIGYASAVSLGVGAIVHWLFDRLGGGK